MIDKYIFKLTILVLLNSVFFLSCTDDYNGQCPDKGDKIIQKISLKNIDVHLIKKEQGAYGTTFILNVCDNEEKAFIESISLRTDLNGHPIIDSLVGRKIYVKYSFPWEGNSQLKFDDVVLGEALINKRELKFQYIFYNRIQNKP